MKNRTADKVGLKDVLCDIWKHLEKKKLSWTLLLSFVFSLLVTTLSWFVDSICLECIREFYNSVSPSLLGFSITIYAVLFSLDDNITNRLKEEATDKRIPYEVLHATFLFGIIVQGGILMFGLLTNAIVNCLPKEFVAFIYWFVLTFIIVWIIHTSLHLYSLRTFR